MLSKKYYIKIAEIMKKHNYPNMKNDLTIYNGNEFLNDLCLYFKADNPLFSANKFRKAVLGLEEN